VTRLSYDLAGRGVVDEAVPPGEVLARFTTLVRSLDGRSRTLVTAEADGGAHLAVGGDAAAWVVVYATFDHQNFSRLARRTGGNSGSITLVAGGQPAEYPARCVVSVDAALRAATPFLLRGHLADDVGWETDPVAG
jgi:hypothetical protein